MSLPIELQIPAAVGIGIFLLVLAAEKLHERRCRAVARLASGPSGKPRRWTRAVPWAKAVTLAGIGWALATLFFSAGGVFSASETEEDRRSHPRHIVFVADLSPSMLLEDAGPDGDLTRLHRASEVVDGILQRLNGDMVFSVIVFYTDSIPVILDARDAELVRNVFDGLPVWYVMEPGKTDLGGGVRLTLEQLEDYSDDSTTVFLCTDGDTVDLGQVGKPPTSVREIYVLGVGNPNQGTFIDDHMSRQDASLLRTLAGRLRGQYIDVNEKHMATPILGALATGMGADKADYRLADIAILVLAVAAAVHALIPVLLEYLGSDWKAVRVHHPALAERTGR